MTPFLWFGVALRAIGVWVIVTGLELGVTGFNALRGLGEADVYVARAYFNQLVAHLVIGLVLIKFAPMIAQWAYPVVRTPVVEEKEEDAEV